MRQTPAEGSEKYWRVAAVTSALTVVLMSGINGALLDTGMGNVPEFVVGTLLGILAIAVFALAVAACTRLVASLPTKAVIVIGGALLAIWFLSANSPESLLRALLDTDSWSWPHGLLDALSPLALASIALAAASLAGLAVLLIDAALGAPGGSYRLLVLSYTVAFTVTAALVLLSLAGDGSDPFPSDGATLEARRGYAGLADPTALGEFQVEYLTYGAGPNERRPDFGSDRDLESRTVNASALLPEWKDFKQRMRERFWGFGLDEAPLNGRIWTPEGNGPFPLVLIVHGNHGMEDYSDGGYAYLAELLASRGFITVSVDENYINGTWSGDFQGKEMAARAWLLLEHLALWRDWNDSAGHRFASRVDMDNIALIGHSRGGEAVSIARLYNDLPHFPDDATVEFDYGFNIRSLVAIAQVDQRYHRRVELKNVNFLTLHGSYDSDEPAYHGMRQFNRIGLDGDGYLIKSGVYIHGANHGQFNSDWGRTDYSPPESWRLNLAPLIPGDEQRQIAKAYIAAFLGATLHDDRRYLELLKDPRAGAAWLPLHTYVHQFTDSTFRALADFEEDLDVTTASQPGATVSTDGLALWREEQLGHRDKLEQGSNAVVVGWRPQGDPTLMIELNDAIDFTGERALVFAVSGSTEKLPPEDDEDAESEDEDDGDPEIADFRVELQDGAGSTASARISEHAQLVPPVRVRYLKNQAINEQRYNSDWEPVLQYVEIPFDAFVAAGPDFDLSGTRRLRFRFEATRQGVLILDDIGIIDLR